MNENNIQIDDIDKHLIDFDIVHENELNSKLGKYISQNILDFVVATINYYFLVFDLRFKMDPKS